MKTLLPAILLTLLTVVIHSVGTHGALAFYWWGALRDFSSSAYYSWTSYSTVGFGDVVLPVS